MEKITKSAGAMYLSRDDEAPMLYAIWLNDDILGAGNTSDEAFAEARKTLAAWKATPSGYAREEETAVIRVRPVSFSEGAWSCTTRDDGFSYCPTFTAEFQDGRLWVIHVDHAEGQIAIFYIDHDDDNTEEREVQRCDIPTEWSFSEVVGAIQYLCAEKAIEQVPLGLVAQLFFAKGW